MDRSIDLSLISLSEIRTFKSVYAIPTIFVETFLLFESNKFLYSVFSLLRYIYVDILKQFCYTFCFFTHVSERYPCIIACTIFVHIILFFFYCVYYSQSLLGSESLSNLFITNYSRNILCINFFILEKQRIHTHKITEKSNRSTCKVFLVARIIGNDIVCSCGFSICRDYQLPFSFTLHIFILISKQFRVFICSCSSVKFRFGEK